jgi:radical SAM superfamily enzyme YgiQ (UPF0313 family)
MLLLINPPNGLYDTSYLAPPLGLLTLASFLKQFKFDVEVLDLNLEMLADNSIDNESFYDQVLNKIIERSPKAVGFTSMCVESHISLEIAKLLKRRSPGIVTIFGGTHFGAIAREILENFDFVDFVAAGEGEHAILSILNLLSNASEELPQNVFYRKNKKIANGQLRSQVYEMDEIPFPAYELVDLKRYFDLNPSHLFNYEGGRGCVFKCEFCYSPFHYGDFFRHKLPQKIVEELGELHRLGARHVFFVQDNFLNSPRWASDVCRQIAKADLPVDWECYATYPQLKESIIDLMAEAGCIGIFTGIDAVSPSSQKRMNKPFLKSWESTSNKLSYLLEKDIQPICAFILEEPDQAVEKVEACLYTALQCVKLGCEIHVNTLSIYNQTGLAKQIETANYNYSSIKPEILFDTPQIVHDNIFARTLPQLFPYHSTTFDVDTWEIFTAKAHLAMALIVGLTGTLIQYVLKEKKSIWNCLDFINSDFVQWLRKVHPHQRNQFVLLEFTKHFARTRLSNEVRINLHIDLTRLLLSNRKIHSFVNISINREEISVKLASFVNIAKLEIPKLFTNEQILNLSEAKLGVFLNRPEDKLFIGVVSDNKEIEIRSVSQDLKKLLVKLERSSLNGTTVDMDWSEYKFLAEDKWIFPENPDG